MPRVFAPTPFRWTDGQDYPYGWFDLADDSKARAMKAAGRVTDGIFDTPDDALTPGVVFQDQNSGALVGRNLARVLSPGGKVRSSVAVTKQTLPWTRLFGANDFNGGNWSRSAELTGTALYVSAQNPANGPAMFRREGASMFVDGAVMSAGVGNLRTFAASISNAANGPLTNTTIALLVFVHRASTGVVNLRIGTDSGNYVVYRWRYDFNMLQEGWNVLLCHTSELIGGANTMPYGQHAYQAGVPSQVASGFGEGWRDSSGGGAGTFAFGSGGTITYVAVEIGGFKNGTLGNGHMWVEGLYYGGREKTRVTLGFDIQGAGLDNAKAIMDKYGLRGYAAVPTSNANPAAPQFLWTASDEARLQQLHNAGWDVIGHSVSHNSLGNYADHSMIRSELEGSRQQSQRLGCLGAGDLFATPNGSSSNRVMHVMRQLGFEWCRNVNTGPMLQCSSLIGWANPLNQGALSIAASGLGDATDLLIATNFIELLKTFGVSGHLYTHSVLDTPTVGLDTKTGVFDSICAFLAAQAAAGAIELVIPTEFLRGGPYTNVEAVLSGPSRLAITPTASPADIINTGFAPIRLLVSGGTVSAITYSRDGTTFDATGLTAGAFDVAPGDRIRITYTVAPTVVQMSI